VLVLVLTVVVLLFNAWSARACGDKLLVLGRGVRFFVDTADYPARILFYVNPNSPGSEKVEFTQLQAIMRQAGHRFSWVTGKEEFAGALKTQRFDLVLADFADAPGLEEMIKASPSKPMLLPWVYQQTKADAQQAKTLAAAAKERYRFALMAPFKVGKFLSTIDQSMELRSKQVETRAKVATTKTSLSK
jgi:DNA-binding NtrC family response regulator